MSIIAFIIGNSNFEFTECQQFCRILTLYMLLQAPRRF